YETDKLKQEKLIEVERAKKNRNLFIISIIAGLLLLSLSFLYIYQQKLKKRAELAEIKLSESENKLKLERKLNNAEMKAIKAQMNPHFLFNAFNSIQEFIIMNNRELASNYLGKFADLMRLYLDHSREKTIPLQEEINATELYLELERIRFEEKLNYSINVAKNVDKSRTYLPPMLIQPFIENSLKHGLLHKKNDRKLDIRFAMIGNVLHCSIADNGIGRHKSALLNARKLKKHKSFATSATQNRIELLNVGREQDITLQIIDLMDDNNEAVGTKVIIQIPNENV
ncbi:MAG: two-component system LytT family sensor kinase, partial [Maribacter sp.]